MKVECQSRVSKKEHVKILHGVLHVSIVNLIADNMILFVVTIIYFFVIVIQLLANIQKGTKRIFKVGRLQLLVGVHSYFFFNVNVKMQQFCTPPDNSPH